MAMAKRIFDSSDTLRKLLANDYATTILKDAGFDINQLPEQDGFTGVDRDIYKLSESEMLVSLYKKLVWDNPVQLNPKVGDNSFLHGFHLPENLKEIFWMNKGMEKMFCDTSLASLKEQLGPDSNADEIYLASLMALSAKFAKNVLVNGEGTKLYMPPNLRSDYGGFNVESCRDARLGAFKRNICAIDPATRDRFFDAMQEYFTKLSEMPRREKMAHNYDLVEKLGGPYFHYDSGNHSDAVKMADNVTIATYVSEKMQETFDGMKKINEEFQV